MSMSIGWSSPAKKHWVCAKCPERVRKALAAYGLSSGDTIDVDSIGMLNALYAATDDIGYKDLADAVEKHDEIVLEIAW